MKTNLAAVALLIGFATVISGCASPARVGNMTATTAPSQRIAESSLRDNIAIKDVTGGQETNPMWKSDVGTPEFQQALEASLRTAGLLASTNEGRYMLSTRLENLDQPVIGLDFTVTASVSYMVTERATGKEVYSRKIAVPFTAKFGDALMGVERLKLANEGAVKVNITQFIQDLYGLHIRNLSLN